MVATLLTTLENVNGISVKEPPDCRAVVDRRLAGEPFTLLNTQRVFGALDAVIGVSRYAREHLQQHGFFFVSFPNFHKPPWAPPLKCGRWHIDTGYDQLDQFSLASRACAIVPVFCLTDAKSGGGVTVALPGSHLTIARLLWIAGQVPRWHMTAFCEALASATSPADVVQMTGEQGDLVLLHPFLVHSFSANTRCEVRVICNTGVDLKNDRDFIGRHPQYPPGDSPPVDAAIWDAIAGCRVSAFSGSKVRGDLAELHRLWRLRYRAHGALPSVSDESNNGRHPSLTRALETHIDRRYRALLEEIRRTSDASHVSTDL